MEHLITTIDTNKMTDYTQLIEEAKMVAFLTHKNQTYDIFPYEKHIKDVVKVLIDHGYSGDDIIGGYLHDGIEDGDLTYNKILKAFGYNVAEIVLAVTDPSDVRNRKEKKIIVYTKIKAYPKATPTKVADRIANVAHGIRMGNHDKTKMYYKEAPEFREALYIEGEHEQLWATLDNLMAIAGEKIK